MKRILCAILAVLLMLSVTACGSKTTSDDETTNTNNSQVEKQDNDAVNEEQDKADEITFDYSYKVPGKNIVIDVPNWQEIEKGFTQLYILHGQQYVAVTANNTATATDLATAHEVAFAKFMENIQNYSYVNSLNVETESTETINGVEVYKYEGTLNCGHDTIYDAYTIGYSFIMDDVPCNVTGSVIDEAQDEEMIAEMKATVEAMIQTLRSER